MKSRVENNAAAILDAMIEKGMSAAEAAKATGLNPATFTELIKRDRPVQYKTAAKLVAVFGEAAVTIMPAETAQGEEP